MSVKTNVANRYTRLHAAYDAVVEQVADKYKALHKQLDDMMRELELSLMAEEVPELEACPVEVGDRVWCSAYKRLGTVASVELCARRWLKDDDYYAPREGLESYSLPCETPTTQWGNGHIGRYYWRIAIDTDPSAKTGSVAAFVWNRRAQPKWVAEDESSDVRYVDSFQEHDGKEYVRAARHETL